MQAPKPQEDIKSQTLTLSEIAIAALLQTRQLAADIVAVAAAETRIVALSILTMTMLALTAGLLVTTCWLMLNAAAYSWLLSHGAHPVYTFLGLAAANLMAALITGLVVYYLSRHLRFSATREALGLTSHDKTS